MRNVMLSPLAGIDPHEILDVRPLARELEERLMNEVALRLLPAKFGFILDGGGVSHLTKSGPTSGLRPLARAERRWWRSEWIVRTALNGSGSPSLPTAAAMAIERSACLSGATPDARRRMRDLSEAAWHQLRSSLAPSLAGMVASVEKRASQPMVGKVTGAGAIVAAGFAAPFGRLDAATLQLLARRAAQPRP